MAELTKSGNIAIQHVDPKLMCESFLAGVPVGSNQQYMDAICGWLTDSAYFVDKKFESAMCQQLKVQAHELMYQLDVDYKHATSDMRKALDKGAAKGADAMQAAYGIPAGVFKPINDAINSIIAPNNNNGNFGFQCGLVAKAAGCPEFMYCAFAAAMCYGEAASDRYRHFADVVCAYIGWAQGWTSGATVEKAWPYAWSKWSGLNGYVPEWSVTGGSMSGNGTDSGANSVVEGAKKSAAQAVSWFGGIASEVFNGTNGKPTTEEISSMLTSEVGSKVYNDFWSKYPSFGSGLGTAVAEGAAHTTDTQVYIEAEAANRARILDAEIAANKRKKLLTIGGVVLAVVVAVVVLSRGD